jgi:hypothetical protein
MFYWPGCDVAIRGTSPTFCEPFFYGNGKYPGIPEMADSIYKGIQLFKNDSADLVGKYLQEMFVDTYMLFCYPFGFFKLFLTFLNIGPYPGF